LGECLNCEVLSMGAMEGEAGRETGTPFGNLGRYNDFKFLQFQKKFRRKNLDKGWLALIMMSFLCLHMSYGLRGG
jgi:hypothetical protein